jgi:putative phosphonate metabolism protein
MAAQTAPRYAIYYAPEPDSALDTFGQTWLGHRGADALAAAIGNNSKVSVARIEQLTDSPRRYGFHGTLKPPFELNAANSPEGLLAAARVFARSRGAIDLPPLELAVIGKFIALTPIAESAALERLAAACVRAFEGFRTPLSKQQEEDYKLNKLTVHQEQMLEHWGYPYVMEEFRFHISLTDRIDDDDERHAVMELLTKLARPVLGQPIRIRDLVVFAQDSVGQPMKTLERIPFGRPA